MDTERNFDSRIKDALQRECDGISATEGLKNRIDEELLSVTRNERRITMRHMNMKRLGITVAAACLLVSGLTVFAGKTFNITVSGSSHTRPDYTDYADLTAAEEKLGYAVDSVEQFSNGYSFVSINVNEMKGQSEEGDTIYTIPELQIRYEKDGKEDEDIDLYIHQRMEEQVYSKEPDLSRTCGDINLRYDECINKFVPVDYVLTEEDKANKEKGNYNIAYGTDEVEIQTSMTVRWEKDGVIYEMLGFELDMSGEEMLDMAEEILLSNE